MYIPHTEKERDEMLRVIGIDQIADLFEDLPASHKFPSLNLPDRLTEMETLAELQSLSWMNESSQDLICFLGAGAYQHFIPSAVDSILRRGEFYTAYTPYQPEVSQGTLQAIFDYQSLITALTGMDVSNASHYDGATSTAEAVSMAIAHFRNKRSKVVVSPSLHPHYRETIRTYNHGGILEIVGDEDDADLLRGPESLYSHIDQKTALVIVQYPDFFGHVFDYTKLAEITHQAGSLLAIAVNPLALGLLKTPGDFGADIVTGEGQPLGIPLSFGGPYLGIFATRKEYIRKMAGRLVGETLDNRGQRAYVLTLTAREQHIRRERATSNICSNQALMVLASTIYMSLLGKHGLRQVSELCYHKAHYAAEKINSLKEFHLWSETPFFNEFVIKCPHPVDEINEYLLDYGVLGGYNLGNHYHKLNQHMLIAVTEMNTKDEIDSLVDLLAEVSND